MNPIAQISAFELYYYPLRSWRDMYRGVPTTVLLFTFLLGVFLAKPKSPILRAPFLVIMFAGFRSLKIRMGLPMNNSFPD